MNTDSEIRRLLDLMPASGRMLTRMISRPEQPVVIESPFPLPWSQHRPIYINFDLWQRIPKPQRDLLLLRTVSWVCGVKWFKPTWHQGLAVAGIVGVTVEALQADFIGVAIASGLTVLAGIQIWRNTQRSELELEADENAIRVAQRRGYTETEAAGYLVAAIATVAQLEGRTTLNFTELIRSQNLKAIAHLSPVSVPQTVRRE